MKNRYQVIYLNEKGERVIAVTNGDNCKDMLETFYHFRPADTDIVSIKNLGKGH